MNKLLLIGSIFIFLLVSTVSADLIVGEDFQGIGQPGGWATSSGTPDYDFPDGYLSNESFARSGGTNAVVTYNASTSSGQDRHNFTWAFKYTTLPSGDDQTFMPTNYLRAGISNNGGNYNMRFRYNSITLGGFTNVFGTYKISANEWYIYQVDYGVGNATGYLFNITSGELLDTIQTTGIISTTLLKTITATSNFIMDDFNIFLNEGFTPADIIDPSVDSIIISNTTPNIGDDISITATCSDSGDGVSYIVMANNATGTMTNITNHTFSAESTAVALENHTATLGIIQWQMTCVDEAGNSVQSGLNIFDDSVNLDDYIFVDTGDQVRTFVGNNTYHPSNGDLLTTTGWTEWAGLGVCNYDSTGQKLGNMSITNTGQCGMLHDIVETAISLDQVFDATFHWAMYENSSDVTAKFYGGYDNTLLAPSHKLMVDTALNTTHYIAEHPSNNTLFPRTDGWNNYTMYIDTSSPPSIEMRINNDLVMNSTFTPELLRAIFLFKDANFQTYWDNIYIWDGNPFERPQTVIGSLNTYLASGSAPVLESIVINNTNPFVNDDVQITAQCSDSDSGISNITFSNNVTGTMSLITNHVFTAGSNVTAFENHTAVVQNVLWQVDCYDSTGLSAQGLVNYTGVDNVDPAVTFIDPTPANGTVIDFLPIIFNVSIVEDSSIDTIIFDFNGTNETNTFSNTHSTFWTLSKDPMATGTFTYNIWVNDTFGNSVQLTESTFDVDNVTPEVTFTYPSPLNTTVTDRVGNFNILGSNIHLVLANLTIYNSSNSIVYQNISTFNASTFTFVDPMTNVFSGQPDGNYTVSGCFIDIVDLEACQEVLMFVTTPVVTTETASVLGIQDTLEETGIGIGKMLNAIRQPIGIFVMFLAVIGGIVALVLGVTHAIRRTIGRL